MKSMVNNLEITAIVVPTPLIYTLLDEFHNCNGHRGLARTLNLLKRKFCGKE